MFNVFNGHKSCNKLLNPLGFLNDGLNELCYTSEAISLGQRGSILNASTQDGKQVYNPSYQTHRFKSLVVTNKSTGSQNLIVDGEQL